MPSYRTKLARREEVAEGTMAFYFEKPAGLDFKAGQFLNYTLLDPPETDAEGNLRSFSIASAPFEEDLLVATRLRDTAFKRVLRTMPLGTEIQAEGPFGSFTLHVDASRPAVFLAGGIGITPFRSMILEASKKRLPHPLFLFYSNRRPEDAAFLQELQEMERQNPNYRFIGTMTKLVDSKRPWHGETGFISATLLNKVMGHLAAPIYYSAGPPAMVQGLHAMLNKAGVADGHIRAEEFAGY